MTDHLRDYFNAQMDDLIALTRDLVALESPTDDKTAVDRMGARVAEELDELGAEIIVHPRSEVGDILEARWQADRPGRPLLLVCHMDTVHPIGALAQNPLRVEDGRLYGPGSYDMKAGIASTLIALRGLRDLRLLPPRPIIALMTSDEETGSFHSRNLIQQRAEGAALALIMEAALPDGALKTARKSVAHFVVRTYGVAAHAGGAHENGVNAIEEMSHQILALQRLTDYTKGTTLNVGVISGGTRANVVPAQCEVQVDVRAATQAEMERVEAAIRGLKPVLPGARVEIEGSFDRPPMERDHLMAKTFRQAQAIAARYGLILRESSTGGASDGNYTAAIGTPTLDGLGPYGDGAHSEREYVRLEALAWSATLVAALLRDWPLDAS